MGQVLEEEDYECNVLNGTAHLVLERPSPHKDHERGWLVIPHPNEREFICDNIANCSIARYDTNGKLILSSYSSCPAFHPIDKTGTLRSLLDSSKLNFAQQTDSA